MDTSRKDLRAWSRGRTGILCPVVVTTSVPQITRLVSGVRERKTARQLAHSRISSVRDELLLGSGGNPIGVRVRYSVSYDDGLDDERNAPLAIVHLDEPPGNLLMLQEPWSRLGPRTYATARYSRVNPAGIAELRILSGASLGLRL